MTPWVKRLIAANVAVFALTNYFLPGLANVLAFVPRYVLLEPWTPITYMFVHAGVSHIFFNMLGLFFFGPPVETRLGPRRFLWLYLASGLGGAALSFILSPQYPIVGASGAVMGVMFAFARYWPREKILIWFIPVEAWLGVIIMSAISLFGATTGFEPGIAHYAHLGGFAGAWVYLVLSDKFSPATKFKAKAAAVRASRATPQDLQRWANISREGLHPVNRDEMNRILDKISASGVASLTPDERAFLDRFVN